MHPRLRRLLPLLAAGLLTAAGAGAADFKDRAIKLGYVTTQDSSYGAGAVPVGRKFWDQLSGDEKKLLQDSCTEARAVERNASHDLDARVLAEMNTKGLQFNEIAPQERARMRDAVKPMVDKYTAVIGADLVKQAYAEI